MREDRRGSRKWWKVERRELERNELNVKKKEEKGRRGKRKELKKNGKWKWRKDGSKQGGMWIEVEIVG